jgi:hypothetical protein
MTANHYYHTLQNLHTKISNRQPGNSIDGIILLHNGAPQSTGPTECHVMKGVQEYRTNGMPCDEKCFNILHTAWTTIEFSHLWVIKGSSPQSQYVHFKWLYTGGCGLGSTPRNSWQTGYAKL